MGKRWDNLHVKVARRPLVFGALVAVLFVVTVIIAIGIRMTSSPSPHSSSLSNAASPHATHSMTTRPTPTSPTPTPTKSTAAPVSANATTFLAMLNELATDDTPSSHGGYERTLFNVWADANRDSCDTRAEVLMMESTSPVTSHGSCTIDTGSWFSAYDGTWFTSASDVDIDHFVPLKEAWVSGAWAWDSATRTSFGNDLGYAASLLAVSASSNRSKSDQDPAHWMPANRDFTCDYVATWVSVKWRWSLTVDGAEKSMLSSTLEGCETFAVTIPERASVSTDPNASSSGSGSGNAGGSGGSGGSGSGDGVIDQNYGTCKVAKSHGRGPYVQGVDPEYDFYRDADSDGVVCE